MGGLAEVPPRVGVGLPTDYELLDLADPRYRWARQFGVQAAGMFRRGAGTPTDPISFIQLTVAVVADWSASESTVEPVPSAVDQSTVELGRSVPPAGPPPEAPGRSSPPAGLFGWTGPAVAAGPDATARSGGAPGSLGWAGPAGSGVPDAWAGSGTPGASDRMGPGGSVGGSGVFGWAEPAAPAGSNGTAVPPDADARDWLRPPAYLLVNGLPAAELVLERRLRPPGSAAGVRSWTVEVLVPLAGTGYVVVVTGATTDPARQDETEWTALAVAGTLTYRAGGPSTPAHVVEQPIPELRFADPERLIAAARHVDTPPPTSPPGPPANPPPGPQAAPPLTGPLPVSVPPAGPASAGLPPVGPALAGPSVGSASGGLPPVGSTSAGSSPVGSVSAGPPSVGVVPGRPAGPPRGTIGQAAVDQLAGLVAGHPATSRAGAGGSA
ncbi:MAG: hypothetical protein V7637_44 [Mycobacteriales bacterium]